MTRRAIQPWNSAITLRFGTTSTKRHSISSIASLPRRAQDKRAATEPFDTEPRVIESLETERLILRAWRDVDRQPFASINADPVVMEFYPACLSRAESDQVADRIENHFRERGFGLFAVQLRHDGTFIGFIGLSVPRFVAHFTPCVEIGWRLAAAYLGQGLATGLATEGARAAVRSGFQTLALHEIVPFTG